MSEVKGDEALLKARLDAGHQLTTVVRAEYIPTVSSPYWENPLTDDHVDP